LKQCIAEIAEALHDLHSRNIVHLDVKPANILVQFSDRYSGSVSLNSDGDIVRDVESDSVVVTFKLGDFGLACSVYDASPEDGDGAYLSWYVWRAGFLQFSLLLTPLFVFVSCAAGS
jgi:serine/threonine protein kinase